MNPIIFNAHGQAVTGGNVGEKLMAANFNVGALRPYIHNNKAWMTLNGKAVPATNNATLLRDEWKAFDDMIIPAFQSELSFVKSIMEAGLTYNLPNPLGTTMLIHQNMSGAQKAQISMDAKVQNQGDTPEFGEGGLPIPIISSGFDLDIRFLNSSRNSGQPLDTTNQEFCARANAEFLENQALFGNGNISETAKLTTNFFDNTACAALRYTVGSYSIDGVMTKDAAVEHSLAYDWLLAATTPVQIVQDVMNMKQELVEQGFKGPYVLNLPAYLSQILDKDYKSTDSSSVMTILNRINMIEGVTVKLHDSLGRTTPATGGTQYINMVMISMSSDVIRIVDGMASTMVQWDTHGGMNSHYRILTIMVPELRTRQAGDCGICKAHFIRA